MSEQSEKPFIDPNSGRSSQPGGAAVYAYELPPTEQKDLAEDVKTQIQDDPEGIAAIDPDQQTTVPEPLLKKIEQEQQESEENTTERTGEVTDGTGKTVVSPEQAEAQGGVAPSPASAGIDQPANDPEKGQLSSPEDASEPKPTPVPEGEAPGQTGQTEAQKKSEEIEAARAEQKKEQAEADKPKTTRGRAAAKDA